MLGGLAMKKRWQEQRTKAGKDTLKPNIVFGSNAQVALEKFARYFDVEMRLVPVDESTRFVMSPKRAMDYIDENTIGVMVILGSTYTGVFENVQEMSDELDAYEAKTKHHVPIHVDAASGGFFAPFAYPKYKWAFDVPRVQSINTSGHNWTRLDHVGPVITGKTQANFEANTSMNLSPSWKDEQFLHKDLVFELHRIARVDLANARAFSRALEASGYYTVVSEIHNKYSGSGVGAAIADAVGQADESSPLHYQRGLPVVAFRFSDTFKQEYPHCKQEWIQNLLRVKGWIVPNYALPPNAENIDVLRVVVRESVSAEMIERLIADLMTTTEELMKKGTSAVMMGTVSEAEDKVISDRTQVVYSKPC
ncbi:hypothetical protein FRB98_009220 [Tulasnella sp. 332]|nr:hypothetical protein FRB98_009220 [Tulasnella sp. 332]